MRFDYIFIILIFLIGFITAYQDLRCGKIRNKWIISGFFAGLFFYLLGFVFGFIPLAHLYKIPLNSGIALLGGYLIWKFNLWSAGDAKLFALFAFLLPLRFYWKTYLSIFPSFVLVLNTFIPALIFVLIKFLIGCIVSPRQIMERLVVGFWLQEVKKIPFAVWLLLWVLLTIVFKGALITLILRIYS